MTFKAKKLPIPGLLWSMYPERSADVTNNHTLNYFLDRFTRRDQSKINHFVGAVRRQEGKPQACNSESFLVELEALQTVLRHDGFTDYHVAKTFSLVNNVFSSILNISLFDTQLIAAYHLLNNRLTEMATGEGKTYAVALASATAALSGVPVHVITANDYLAERDAITLKPLYQALGLTVDAAIHGQSSERRQQAYACDITYCTAKELVFDYLRDAIQRKKQPTIWHAESNDNTGMLLLRGLCMAIIDEADSILIDEARVPLILSQAVKNDQESQYYSQSLNIAAHLVADEDFQLSVAPMQVALTESGAGKLQSAAYALPAVWHNKLHREEIACQALAALHLYHKDQHYIVQEDAVHIIDETTGRIAKGRAWSRGLHQLIELKENIKPSDSLSTISQITYQRFFPRYHRLSGISGTLQESRSELFKMYGLCISKVPLRTPSLRETYPTKLFACQPTLNDALVNRISTIQQAGRPILIGTESVSASETLSQRLNNASINHVVLNAKNDESEAELITRAGQVNAITITTNMAGRGTDIKLGNKVNDLGGLHVISCQVNHSRRIDRQLIGRCARQGDQGSTETWTSLNSVLLQQKVPTWLTTLIKRVAQHLPSNIIKIVICLAQQSEERHQSMLRKRLLSTDKELDKNLSFGGVHE